MAPSTGFVTVVSTLLLCLGCSSSVSASASGEDPAAAGLSGGQVAGIVGGSVAAGFVVVLLGLLIWCLGRRRKVASNTEKPGSHSVANGKPSRRCFPRRGFFAPRVAQRVPVPLFQSNPKLDDGDDFSDTSFVLPELGGPNPHNKFDGMEWVDIKGMDDDVLVDISTDLRKYQQQPQRP